MDELNPRDDRDALSRPAGSTADETLRSRERVPDDLHRDGGASGDEIGEAVGGISGVLTGAAIGSLGGPVGTIIGGIAGAVSGWWAGRAISEAASHVTHEDEDYYRTHYEGSTSRPADRSYDDVRPAYQIGHLAGRNPDYQTRPFDEVETDLRRGWSSDVTANHGSWDQVRGYAQHAYERGRSGFGTGAVAGAAAGTTATAADHSFGSTTGVAAGGTGSSSGSVGGSLAGTADRAGNAAEHAWDSTKAGAENLGHRAGNTIDDLKDRVDGNPASRPGLDATDRPGYGATGATGATSGTSGAATRTWDSANAGADRLGDKADDAWDKTKAGAASLGDKAENAWDKTKAGVEHLGHRAANALDDAKDRVDGDPASRPGPDSTDRPAR